MAPSPEPVLDLYLERTQVGNTTVLFSDDIQNPFENNLVILTAGDDERLGSPRVMRVQLSPFEGDA